MHSCLQHVRLIACRLPWRSRITNVSLFRHASPNQAARPSQFGVRHSRHPVMRVRQTKTRVLCTRIAAHGLPCACACSVPRPPCRSEFFSLSRLTQASARLSGVAQAEWRDGATNMHKMRRPLRVTPARDDSEQSDSPASPAQRRSRKSRERGLYMASSIYFLGPL